MQVQQVPSIQTIQTSRPFEAKVPQEMRSPQEMPQALHPNPGQGLQEMFLAIHEERGKEQGEEEASIAGASSSSETDEDRNGPPKEILHKGEEDEGLQVLLPIHNEERQMAQQRAS
jgi:hypothetical protein